MKRTTNYQKKKRTGSKPILNLGRKYETVRQDDYRHLRGSTCD
nr:MAG TPA: hypothetical protein [Caudoviricetes sp.]